MNLRRRDLFRLAGAWLLACGDNDRFRLPGENHAAAVFEPDTDSFVVALWSRLARQASLEVRSGDQIVQTQSAPIGASRSTAIAVTGLTPSTAYQVTIVTDDGTLLGPHLVRTAPSDDDPRPVRLAVSADLDPSPEFDSALLVQLAAADPDLYVSIGDFPYTDNGPPAMTVAEYRARHAELRTTPKVRAWLQSVGMRAIYDDHEFRNDWDAHWVAVEPDRYAAAIQVWDEFFPLRAAIGEIRYRRWRYGAHAECFLLDTRRFRSADAAPDDASKTMLGAAQHQWLLDAVRASTAPFKLIFTTVPLDFGMGDDHWSSFTTERDAMFAGLVGIPGVLFVSGDQHYFAAHRHAYGIREFQVGPLARGLGTPGPDAPGVLFRSVQYNFGLIDIADDQLTFSGIAADGTRFYTETFSSAALTPT